MDKTTITVHQGRLNTKNCRMTEPGLSVVAPDSGVIMAAPVSVCYQVSTIGQRFSPMALKYHVQACG